MKDLFNEEQLMVLKEISQNKELTAKVRWWTRQEKIQDCCPITTTSRMAPVKDCKQLCWKIWPDLAYKFACCPCFADKPAKEAAQIILEDVKDGNQN